VADKTFAPTAEEVFNRIDDLFSYLKSGILINRIEENDYPIAHNPLLAGLAPYIVRDVFIDTPSREVVIAALRYPHYNSSDSRYFILLHEEYTWSSRNTVIAECTEKEFNKAISKIDEIYRWYREHRADLSARKTSTLADILSNTTDEGREQLLKLLADLRKR